VEIFMDTTLVAKVAGIVRQAAKVPPHVTIAEESRLVEDLGIDSLDLVGVLLAIQDHFDIAIEDDVVPSLRRVADLAEVVAKDQDKDKDRGLAAA
jgi:acyl carrier protein